MKTTVSMNIFALSRYGYTWEKHVERETMSMTKWEKANFIKRLVSEFKSIQEEAKETLNNE